MDQMKKRNYMNQSEDFQSWFPYIVVHNRGEQKNWKTGKKKTVKKNRVKPVRTGFCPKKPNRTETGRLELVSVFFLKKFGLVVFFFI
jgi:hypothetical protein